MIDIHTLIDFTLPNPKTTMEWIAKSITLMNKSPGAISFIFCDDTYLLSINQEYLAHNTYTDIISFDYSKNNILSGDIFISIERVRENSILFNTSFIDELHRVMIHGILHYAGFNDKSDAEKIIMREQEDYYLSLRTF